MRTHRWLAWALVGPLWLCPLARADVQPISPEQLAGHGVPEGVAASVLPRGALLHVQCNGLLPVVEGVEGILKAAAPRQALPPDAQQLLDTPHPLLVLAGMPFGAPLDEGQIAQNFGLAVSEPATISLYLGDPRRMFLVTLPMAGAEPLGRLLTGALQPREVERVTLGSGAALRLVPGTGPVPELYVACSRDRAYLSGDRALVTSLFALPPAERMSADGFLARALAESAGQHVALIVDPRLIKPVALQLAQLQPLGMELLRQKRQELLANLPAPVRQQIELQFQAQFGVANLEQFADFVEVVADVTSRHLLDGLTTQLLSFEGLCLTARLEAQFPELGLKVYGQQYQPATAVQPIPQAEVIVALRRIGSDHPRLSVTGRTPPAAGHPGLQRWVAALREHFARRNLVSSWFDRFATLLEETRPLPAMESQVPWTLTWDAPVDAPPDVAQAESLTAYLQSLRLPLRRAVKLLPGADPAWLERHLREEADLRHHNREAEVAFNRLTAGQEPWFLHANRVEVREAEDPIRHLVTESVWTTRAGFFGYDQHEWINRRWYFARRLDGSLVYHQGGASGDWLRALEQAPARALTPAVAKLLDRLPPDANFFEIQRSLQQLPAFVDWLAALEQRVHTDLDGYLAQARRVAEGTEDLATFRTRMARVPMPELLYALHRDPDSGALYATLPGNLRYPRARVVPLLQELLAPYAAVAPELGGSLVYTRVGPGVYQVGLLQSTEAFTRLVSTLGNAIAQTHLASPAAQQRLRTRLWSHEDGDPAAFSQILIANPRWYFLPRPQPRTPAQPVHDIPERDPDTPEEALDLSAYYNAALNDSWHAGGLPQNTLENLPTGTQVLGGVTFDVRGVIQLAGRLAYEQLSVEFPRTVEGMRVGRSAHRLHFLHACGWPSAPGTVIGHYVVHYADGGREEIPIVYGEDVCDWWTPASGTSTATVAWSGPNLANPSGPPKSLYLSTWVNPRPDAEIRALDYRSTMSDSAPFLIALSVE